MKTNLFMESVEPGAVVLTDAPRFGACPGISRTRT